MYVLLLPPGIKGRDIPKKKKIILKILKMIIVSFKDYLKLIN